MKRIMLSTVIVALFVAGLLVAPRAATPHTRDRAKKSAAAVAQHSDSVGHAGPSRPVRARSTKADQPADPVRPAEAPQQDRCNDPYPCGGEWPADLTGPFELAGMRNVQVPAHDGVLLDGWIASPAVPDGVRTPTILVTSPYFDTIYVGGPAVFRGPASPLVTPAVGRDVLPPSLTGAGWWEDGPMSASVHTHGIGFPPIRLIRRGYTLAYFSVRGTGSSGGCFEFGGAREQRDQKTLVEWLAAQPWSNGRVGISGLSYMSWTAWQAAVQAPSALKAIVTAGDIVDLYEFIHSPQGARSAYVDGFVMQYGANMTLAAGVISGRTGFVEREGCPHTDLAAQDLGSLVTGDRNAPYWQERALQPRLRSVKAAVLDTGGYFDVSAHEFQNSAIWGALDPKTPRMQVSGWWGHDWPFHGNAWATTLDFPSGTADWETIVAGWFDYWLKGIGSVPRTGTVFHQDQDLHWHEASSWSPKPAKKEVLYLSDVGLETTPHDGRASFHSVPQGDLSWGEHALDIGVPQTAGTEPSLCPDPAHANLSRSYLTPPATNDTLIAGNPFVYLSLASDMPGGAVTVQLFDIAPDFACTGAVYSGARFISVGSADLNFYDTPFISRAFPVNTPRKVRIDLTDITYSLARGHRLALTLSHGEIWERAGTLVFPTITINGGNAVDASHLVLPVAEGTFGGLAPSVRYPRRPFTPRGYTD